MSIPVATFEKIVLKELSNHNLAIFAGAGLSRGCGFVDWKGLLRDIADELNLSIDKESDLVAVAQYHCNANGRQTINEAIVKEFQRISEKNENMDILSRLPIDTYWTTNYDSIIEDTLTIANKIVDKKIYQSQMKNYKPNRNVVVYKMHGDREFPDDAVITRDDYERYDIERALFTTQLKGELISKTFIFIGFSFQDPNLEQILSKVRVDLLGKSPKNHYCFLKKVNQADNCYKNVDGSINYGDYNYDKIKQDLKIQDLKRYGINSVVVDNYSEITNILQGIERKFKVNKIFISGSAEKYGNYTEEEAKSLLHNLSQSLVCNNHHIISGFGMGVGSYVINGALEAIYSNKNKTTNDYLTLRPFPQFESGNKKLKDLWTEYRTDMISDSGVIILLFGNKVDNTGDIIVANGMIEEYQIAKNAGKFIIPIGSTGYAAETILNEVKKDLDTYSYLVESIDILAKEKDEQKIINEVNIIIDRIRKGM